MPKLILGLIGQQGCGKGTVADMLRQQYGAGYFRFSGILGDILDRLSVEKTRDHFIQLSEALRKTFGEDVLSYAIEKDAVSAKGDLVVIDGIRRIEDVALLEPLPSFKLLAITAPARLRFTRMKHRGEKSGEQNMTWKQFLADENAPTEATIPAVMARAWKTISNAGSRASLEKRVHALMKELGVSRV